MSFQPHLGEPFGDIAFFKLFMPIEVMSQPYSSSSPSKFAGSPRQT